MMLPSGAASTPNRAGVSFESDIDRQPDSKFAVCELSVGKPRLRDNRSFRRRMIAHSQLRRRGLGKGGNLYPSPAVEYKPQADGPQLGAFEDDGCVAHGFSAVVVSRRY